MPAHVELEALEGGHGQYGVLTVLDIRGDNHERGHFADVGGPAGADLELGLCRLASEGFESVSVGYDVEGTPATSAC